MTHLIAWMTPRANQDGVVSRSEADASAGSLGDWLGPAVNGSEPVSNTSFEAVAQMKPLLGKTISLDWARSSGGVVGIRPC